MTAVAPRYIRWFHDITLDDVPLVGGKTASLGELHRELTGAGLRVPDGFAITADAYTAILDADGVRDRIAGLLHGIDGRDVTALAKAGAAIRAIVEAAVWPVELERAIGQAYATLGGSHGQECRGRGALQRDGRGSCPRRASPVSRRRSSTSAASEPLLDACRQCFASLFTDRAISYRVDHGFDHFAVAPVDRRAADGALRPRRRRRDVHARHRERLPRRGADQQRLRPRRERRQGPVDPDEFLVFKPTLKQGSRPILKRASGPRQEKLDLRHRRRPQHAERPGPAEDRVRLSLTDDDVLDAGPLGPCAIEDHYSPGPARPTPMDIEWAKDGPTGELFILQARPETVHARGPATRRGGLSAGAARAGAAVTGRSVGQKIGAGPVRVVQTPEPICRTSSPARSWWPT